MLGSPPIILRKLGNLPASQGRGLAELVAFESNPEVEYSVIAEDEALLLYTEWHTEPNIGNRRFLVAQLKLRHPEVFATEKSPRDWRAFLITTLSGTLAIVNDTALLAASLLESTEPDTPINATELARVIKSENGSKGTNLPDALIKMATKPENPYLEELEKRSGSPKAYILTEAARSRLTELEAMYHRITSTAAPTAAPEPQPTPTD